MISTFNDWADFWRYEIGVDVIIAYTQIKSTFVEWSEYQIEEVSEEHHKEWKDKNAFNNGIAIIVGKIKRGKYKDKFLACIDLDNKKGIDEFLSSFGKLDSLEKLAEKTVVEQHLDDKNKAHIYFIVENPLKKKSGIRSSRVDSSDLPAIEVKSEGSHGIMFCCPSIHKNGFPYRIIGTKEPTVLDKEKSEILEKCIAEIYQKFELSERNDDGLIPIEDLFKKDFKVSEGNNRHEALLRVMESLIQRLRNIYSEEKIKDLAWQYNIEHFEPYLDKKEFEKQWDDAKNFVVKNKKTDNRDPEVNNDESFLLNKINERYIKIFYDQLNKLYVMIKINDHIECIPIESKRFKSLLRKEFFEIEGRSISDERLERLINLIVSQKIFDESIRQTELQLRVAKKDDVFYYDLTNPKWEIVKISSAGWEIIKNAEIPLFKRYERNSNPQVNPLEDKNNEKYFKEFLSLFNLRTTIDRLLLEIYVISLFIPEIQKAILVISGNGGGAKTTTFSLIKNIIDPSTIDTLSFSPNKNDLIQALEHNYVSYFDNVSSISLGVSDILCRAVTGSGDSKRELYTTDDVFVYKFKRCLGINGINLVTTRPDFIDRSLILKVERIPEENRKKEEDIKKEFERLRPFVLGYIFDILAKYLNYKEKHKEEIIVKNPPRMADFAESCEIISRCLGYADNAFINGYRENIDNQNDEIIEASPIAESIIAFMENKQRWIGTPTQLYQYLGDIISQVDSNIKRSSYWPKGPNRLTFKINEIVPNLLKKNIEIVTGEKIKGQRVIIIKRIDLNHSLDPEAADNNSNALSDNITEHLSSYINLHIHRRGSSDIFECEKCSLTGDLHLMKEHPCKKDLTVLR